MLMDHDVKVVPPLHTMTKRQLLEALEDVPMDTPLTVQGTEAGWWLNLIGVDADPDNITVILETRDDFSPETVNWEVPKHVLKTETC